MKNLLLSLLSFALLPVTICRLYAQEPATQHTRYAGKDFWITKQNTGAFEDLFISSKHNATVTFTYTTNNSSYTTGVPANTVVTMRLPNMNLAETIGMETVQDKSLHIAADSDVVVQYADWGGMVDDGSLIYPSDRQRYGNVYYLNGLPLLLYTGSVLPNGGGFSIVATCDNVLLEITPAKDLSGHLAGIPFTITLNKGQTYAIASSATNPIRDISGTKIEVKEASCCNPINVFNTGICGFSYWPYTGPAMAACDYFFEQLLPVSSWDTSYYLLPYRNNPYTIIKIVSSGNNNPVTVNGATIATLNEGGTLDTIIREPVHVASLLPVSVSTHMVAMEASTGLSPVPPADSFSDPNSAMVISMRDGIREAWFHTVGQSIPNPWGGAYNLFHALAIVSKAANVGTIMLNSNSLASQFHPFPGNPGYMYAYIKPDTGILYHLTSADKIVANYYAAANCGSLDFALGDVNSYVFFDELPADTINICAMDTPVLNAGPGLTYEWSTGDTTREISVPDTGMYTVLKHQGVGHCIDDVKKTFVVRRYPAYLKPMDLGPDTTICKGDQIVLHGQGPSTAWSTGESGASITVHEPGTYWAMLEDTCLLDLVADTMVLADDICLWRFCTFNLPNAFSPNGDGLNDVLLPVYRGQLDKYSLNIFNRLGQRVFSSSQPGVGWDGRIKGAAADVGVYYYNCLFYCPLRGYVQLKGDVSLIR